MKFGLLVVATLFSISSYANCLNLSFIAYEIKCTDGQCIAPALSPYPIKINLNSNKEGEYKYSRSLGNVKIESSLFLKELASNYSLKIKTEYKSTDGNFGTVTDELIVEDLTTFQGKEIKGNSIVVGNAQYFPRVGVFPAHIDLCSSNH